MAKKKEDNIEEIIEEKVEEKVEVKKPKKTKTKKRIVIILDYYVYRNYIDYICYLFHFRPHIPFTIHTVVHVTSGLYADTGQCCPILYVLLPITIPHQGNKDCIRILPDLRYSILL